MFDVPKAGEDFTLATGGGTTTGDVDVGEVGMTLDTGGEEVAADEEAVLTGATVTGAAEEPGDEACDVPDDGAAADGRLELVDALPPEVQAVTSIINPRTAATGARRTEDISGTRLTDQPDETRSAPPPPAEADRRNDTVWDRRPPVRRENRRVPATE